MPTIDPAPLQVTTNPTARRRSYFIAGPRALTALLFLSVLLSGCGKPPADIPATIVVAASATMNEPRPVLAAPDRALLNAVGAGSMNGTAYVVDPNTGQAAEVSLTPRRPGGQVDHGPDRDRRLAGNVDEVQRLLDRESADKPFDLLTWIAQAVRVTSGPGTLLVVSSGLSTAGGFDLRQVGWSAAPHAAAVMLGRRGLLPPLAGWHVIFSGLGDTAGQQPALPLPQRAELTQYWLAICRQAGATSCTVDPVTRAEPPSRSTTPVPIVPVPTVTSIRGPRGQIRTIVPADEFFAFNSARLLPGADTILGPVAAQARTRHLTVSITGYASPDAGTAAYNLALSAARARAVQARLIALGVPRPLIVSVTGAGTAGIPRAACYRRGSIDETVCGRLRRVVITLLPA